MAVDVPGRFASTRTVPAVELLLLYELGLVQKKKRIRIITSVTVQRMTLKFSEINKLDLLRAIKYAISCLA